VDGDGNENVKEKGFDWKNNNFAHASSFFRNDFFTVTALRLENA